MPRAQPPSRGGRHWKQSRKYACAAPFETLAMPFDSAQDKLAPQERGHAKSLAQAIYDYPDKWYTEQGRTRGKDRGLHPGNVDQRWPVQAVA